MLERTPDPGPRIGNSVRKCFLLTGGNLQQDQAHMLLMDDIKGGGEGGIGERTARGYTSYRKIISYSQDAGSSCIVGAVNVHLWSQGEEGRMRREEAEQRRRRRRREEQRGGEMRQRARRARRGVDEGEEKKKRRRRRGEKDS